MAAASLGDCCCPGDVKVKVRSICLEGDLNVTLDDPGRAVAEKCNGVSTKKSFGKRRKIGNITRVPIRGGAGHWAVQQAPRPYFWVIYGVSFKSTSPTRIANIKKATYTKFCSRISVMSRDKFLKYLSRVKC